ncbi:autophagy protein 13 [Malassezia sp. CBS 17886]|nr:autophagy protein 13 [Malassezia sp. CBS 17886]
MSASPLPAPRRAPSGAVSKLDTVLYHFFSKTVAVAADSRLTEPGGVAERSTAARSNKWFSLALSDVDHFRDVLRPWRTLSADPAHRRACPMVIDICLRTAALGPDHVVVAHTNGHGRASAMELGDASSAPLVLERWHVDLCDETGPREERLPAVYKHAIVHFRTLYALACALPAHAVARRIRDAKRASDGAEALLDMDLVVHSGYVRLPAVPGAAAWDLAPISTPAGMLRCQVQYHAYARVSVERRGEFAVGSVAGPSGAASAASPLAARSTARPSAAPPPRVQIPAGAFLLPTRARSSMPRVPSAGGAPLPESLRAGAGEGGSRAAGVPGAAPGSGGGARDAGVLAHTQSPLDRCMWSSTTAVRDVFLESTPALPGARDAPPGEMVATRLSHSPSLSMSHWRRRPMSVPYATDTGTSPRMSALQTGSMSPHRDAGASPLSLNRGAGLRSLFQAHSAGTRARPGVSPSSSSLRSLSHGVFDMVMATGADGGTDGGAISMRESALVSASPSASHSPGVHGGVPHSQPQRIGRYSRQLSYRQREYSRSLGTGADGAPESTGSGARSWTQRMEHRRMMERSMSHAPGVGGVQTSAPETSPGASRLFAGAPHVPAFMLGKPPMSPSELPLRPGDDLLELVKMIDTSHSLHGTPSMRGARAMPHAAGASSPSPGDPLTPRSLGWCDAPRIAAHAADSGACAQSIPPRSEGHFYDDLLLRMADSTRLCALDRAFGDAPLQVSSLPTRPAGVAGVAGVAGAPPPRSGSAHANPANGSRDATRSLALSSVPLHFMDSASDALGDAMDDDAATGKTGASPSSDAAPNPMYHAPRVDLPGLHGWRREVGGTEGVLRRGSG